MYTVKCKRCRGTGKWYIHRAEWIRCPWCQGKGEYVLPSLKSDGTIHFGGKA